MKKTPAQFLVAILLSFVPFIRAAERLVPSQYPTIQAAVNAAAQDDVIRLAPGDYLEQANVLSKRLSIVGDTGAVLHAHPDMHPVPWSIAVAIFGFERASVVVSNLVFEGNLLADSYPAFTGIIYRSSSGRLENCTIRGFRGSSELPGTARGVNVNNILDNGIINVDVVGCSFSNNQISLVMYGSETDLGNTRLKFTIRSNSFTGLGADAFDSVGLWVSTATAGVVHGNTFVDHSYPTPPNESDGSVAIGLNDGNFETRGYFYPLRPIQLSNNVFSNNHLHIGASAANNAIITNNVFGALAPGSTGYGIQLSGTNTLIAGNNFETTAGSILLDGQGDEILGVPFGVAKNAKIQDNWFTNVTSTITAHSPATYTETNSQTCCFAPTLGTLQLQNSSLLSPIRLWHGRVTTIETSQDLMVWTPVQTNTTALPLSVFEIPRDSVQDRQFFRARQ